ncbi:hypothetical protein ID866_5968 [Astraeus odoratus]|nr:hypothetical protein ID866_5968 [Astraeus odoratus]
MAQQRCPASPAFPLGNGQPRAGAVVHPAGGNVADGARGADYLAAGRPAQPAAAGR